MIRFENFFLRFWAFPSWTVFKVSLQLFPEGSLGKIIPEVPFEYGAFPPGTEADFYELKDNVSDCITARFEILICVVSGGPGLIFKHVCNFHPNKISCLADVRVFF